MGFLVWSFLAVLTLVVRQDYVGTCICLLFAFHFHNVNEINELRRMFNNHRHVTIYDEPEKESEDDNV
jgi:hypothetical protein